MARRRKKLSARHRRKISRSLSRRSRGGAKQSGDRLKNAETMSKVVRNIALASESPSKIARNTSVTARNISSLTYKSDRNLRRLQRGSRSLDSLSRVVNRSRKLF